MAPIKHRAWRKLGWVLVLLLGLHGCTEPSSSSVAPATTTATATQLNSDLERRVELLFAQLNRRFQINHAELLRQAQQLTDSIDILLVDPTAERLNASRAAWLKAHNAYQRSLLARHLARGLGTDADSLEMMQLEYQIDHWPILPGYVDALPDYPDTGLVSDATVALDAESLRQQHGLFDLNEATVGFHVIEFLLWGENADRASARPATDFEPSAALTPAQLDSGVTAEQLPRNRRRQYLSLAAEMLLADISEQGELWTGILDEDGRADPAVDGGTLMFALTGALMELLSEELLLRSLYPLLNGDFDTGLQSPYSHSSDNSVAALLASIEEVLIETSSDGENMDAVMASLSEDYQRSFHSTFDSSKECLVLLYSTVSPSENPESNLQTEVEIVECINLLASLNEYFQQVQQALSA